ncbi:hypothetical protein AB0442_34680 [Kitasatospora sp. NPDC085895]|uniref:hypothetical protein n=1 Tax=Kitasatospora sp. NPDC085895 TaxID=3155057 RepID=UPI0034503C17
MTTAAEVAGAYKWTRDWMKEPLLPLPEIHNPAQGAVAEPLLEGATGLTGSPTAPIGDALNSDTDIDAVARDLDGRPAAPAYRVPRSRIEEAFG